MEISYEIIAEILIIGDGGLDWPQEWEMPGFTYIASRASGILKDWI